MLSENRWKVILLVAAASVSAEPTRALSLVYQRPYKNIMFIPKQRNRKQRVLFLDEDENHQPVGRGEIDLTLTQDSKIKFDDATDYEFTSPDKSDKDSPSGNERFYEPSPRFRAAFQAYPTYYHGRYGRPYAPNFGFDPYTPPLPFAPSRNSFYGASNGWKARSPRVVFPYASDSVNVNNINSVQTNSHGGPGAFDSVVFRDQNFGLNDIGTDEQSLQDIGTGNADAFAERDANDLHRARYNEKNEIKTKKRLLQKPMFIQTEGIRIPPHLKRVDFLEYANNTIGTAVLPKFKPISDEQMEKISQILKELPKSTNQVSKYSTNRGRKGRLLDNIPDDSRIEVVTENPQKEDRKDEKRCPQGGTCEFFFYCWMVGGLLEGSCGGVLKGCCHRVAKAGLLGVQDSNSIEFSPNEGLSYGPVINDESKWTDI